LVLVATCTVATPNRGVMVRLVVLMPDPAGSFVWFRRLGRLGWFA